MSLESRIRDLEKASSRLRQAMSRDGSYWLADDEIIESLKSGNFDRRHLDALFSIIEPGLTGKLLLASASLRRDLLLKENPPASDSGSPLSGARWLTACGADLILPSDSEVWRKILIENPADESQRAEQRNMTYIFDAHRGLATRMLRGDRLDHFATLVATMAECWGDSIELAQLHLPQVEEAQRNRMARLFEPLSPIWHESLMVLSPDGSGILETRKGP